MNKTDANVMSMNTETAANDLTQLSSREQLSALMDGALPPDQTRFLLRRLQHDAPLAGCWERWRLTGEVMRGLAPAQRLPADFATRVAAALDGDVAATPEAAARTGAMRTPAWLRWGGGAAMAASLAVVALMARQPAAEAPAAASVQLASSSAPAVVSPAPVAASEAAAPPEAEDAAQTLAAASAIAVASTTRPVRSRAVEARTPARAVVARNDAAETQVAAAGDAILGSGAGIPQPDIVTRPWPRSVLPQYASGGLAVGFGEHARGATAYNPFQSQAGIGTMTPVAANADEGNGNAARQPQQANIEPQP